MPGVLSEDVSLGPSLLQPPAWRLCTCLPLRAQSHLRQGASLTRISFLEVLAFRGENKASPDSTRRFRLMLLRPQRGHSMVTSG